MLNNKNNDDELKGIIVLGPVKELTDSSLIIAVSPFSFAKFKIDEYTKLVNAESISEIEEKQIIAIRHFVKANETEGDKNNRYAHLVNANPLTEGDPTKFMRASWLQ
jgi:hypothetical protein